MSLMQVPSPPYEHMTMTRKSLYLMQSGGAAAAGVCTAISNPALPLAQIASTCGLQVTGNFQCSGQFRDSHSHRTVA